jgi:hypothetical protein
VALDLTQYLAKLEVAGAFAWVAPQLQEYAADSAVETYLDGVDVGAELAWVAAGQKGAPRRSAETESVIDGGIDSALGKTRAVDRCHRLFRGELLLSAEQATTLRPGAP